MIESYDFFKHVNVSINQIFSSSEFRKCKNLHGYPIIKIENL